MEHTITITPAELRELIAALARNKAKIAQSIRYNDRKMQTPEGQALWATEPTRKQYRETVQYRRAERIRTIDGLLAILEPLEEKQK